MNSILLRARARTWLGLLASGVLILLTTSSFAQTSGYSTGFEAWEGYDGDFTLVGQDGWVGYGSGPSGDIGGNGIVTNYFEGFGQQAYIGYSPPAEKAQFCSVFRPVNLASINPGAAVVKFSVLMQIVDSSSDNGHRDDFRWSFYNTDGTRLFSLDFDNASQLISCLLDGDSKFASTGCAFDNLGSYQLAVTMNFARNLWSATLEGQVLVHAKPITTTGAPLNLGDVDAVWFMADPQQPGNNYMLFDDYSISLEPGSSIPPALELLGFGGGSSLRLYGEPGLEYRIEVSSDLLSWAPLTTLSAPISGILEFRDPNPAQGHQRFYRASQSP